MAVFEIVLNKTVIMMALMAIGYFFGRKGIVSENAGRDLAVITTKFFLPAYLFHTLAKNIAPDALAENAVYLARGTAFLALIMLVSFGISRLVPGDRLTKLMTYYMLSFPNIAYFGYPIIQAAYGDVALTQFIIFALPSVIVLNTYGTYILTAKRSNAALNTRFSAKNLRSLPFELLIGVALGMLVGLVQIPLPAAVSGIFEFAAQGMSPLSMVLAGVILSRQPLSRLFRLPHAYLACTLKIFILPAIIGAVAYLLGLRGHHLIFPVAMTCLPVGMNVVVLSRPEHEDYTTTAVVCFISYIFGLIGIPTVIALASAIS